MGHAFGHLGLNFRELIQRAAPPCPDAGQPIRMGRPDLSHARHFAVAQTTDTSDGNTANVLIVDDAALVKDQVYLLRRAARLAFSTTSGKA